MHNVCCVTVQHKYNHDINQYKYKLNYKSQEKGLIQVYHHNIGMHCIWNKKYNQEEEYPDHLIHTKSTTSVKF